MRYGPHSSLEKRILEQTLTLGGRDTVNLMLSAELEHKIATDTVRFFPPDSLPIAQGQTSFVEY